MKPYDERLQYYLMLARLLAEADLQLEADADDPGSAPMARDLPNSAPRWRRPLSA